MAEAPVSTNREDWIGLALRILVEEGAGEVKILTLANLLGCSRSNFYWFFRDRELCFLNSLPTGRPVIPLPSSNALHVPPPAFPMAC